MIIINFNTEFFDKGIERHNTDCEKWDLAEKEYGEGILPLWVADMDFEALPSIANTIIERVACNTYGYTGITDDDYDAFFNFMKRRHNVIINRNESQMMSCVVTSLKTCVRIFTSINDKVVVQTPVYGPFLTSITSNKRNLVENKLVSNNGRYKMDFMNLERIFTQGAKLMLICNPHNPVSRVWTEEELCKLVKLAKEYDVLLVSDEIHADFVFENKFTSLLNIGDQLNYYGIICLFSASKTFNVAGLKQSQLVTRNNEILKAISDEVYNAGLSHGNIFALKATREAYNNGDNWLDGLISYLNTSRQLLIDTLNKELPQVKVTPIEATYLAWLDMRAFGLTTEEIMKKTIDNKVLFTSGTFFSKELGEGFIRFNFACPKESIIEGVKRLKQSLLK